MSSLPMLDLAQLAPTRDYLQDIAKIVGKAQQQFLPADPNAWDKGLLVTSIGLSSQELNDNQFIIDFKKSQLRGFGQSWQLGSIHPREILQAIRSLTGRQVETPELATDIVAYDPAQAERLLEVLYFSAQELSDLGRKLTDGAVSPVLLYPHHFDVSLVWYPHRLAAGDSDQRQFTMGFSIGDQDINQAYFYVTAYPEPAGFTAIKLPPPAYWQNQGFSGAILNYADIAAKNPSKLLDEFFGTILYVQFDSEIL
ncbi:MAG: DUF5996 family protein [Candidatus Saccharimonadales bacterium]